MKPIDQYDLNELKRIYLILHAALPKQPELMDSDLLHDLQRHLQAEAKQQGVDASLHAQWIAWLNDGQPPLGEV